MREHGYARYKLDGCRCYPCAAEVSAYNERRNREIAYGTWQPFLDAETVRQHLLRLRECGIGTRRVAVLANVNRSLVTNILYGKPGKEPGLRVRTQNALRILAIEPTIDNVAPSTPIGSTGSHRRIQALVVIGWSQAKLAGRLGITPTNFSTMMRAGQVTAATAAKVRALYNELWDQAPPEQTHRDKIAAARARNAARASGWAPPMAWDDDLIDLPDAELAEELKRRAAAMDDIETVRCHTARYKHGDKSPLTVAGAHEHNRRLAARKEAAAAGLDLGVSA